jgi:hypothetical protein
VRKDAEVDVHSKVDREENTVFERIVVEIAVIECPSRIVRSIQTARSRIVSESRIIASEVNGEICNLAGQGVGNRDAGRDICRAVRHID